MRRAPDEDEGLVLDLPRHARALASRGGGVVNGIPLNAPINNPVGDGANAAQSGLSMALLGNFGMAAWNGGQGFITPPADRARRVHDRRRCDPGSTIGARRRS